MIKKADLDRVRNELDKLYGLLDDPPPPPPPPDEGEAALRAAIIAPNSARDVYHWDKTCTFAIKAVVPGYIDFTFDADWPERIVYGGAVRANVWFMAKLAGVWHAGTFDWIRDNTRKTLGVPEEWPDTAHALASHIKHGPLAGYVPQRGHHCGMFVSSLARNGYTTVNERSNVALFDWPY